MSRKSKISTESYKGVRDFYPHDMFIENYIFTVMRKTVERFGYVEYGASILEPAELYRSKTNQEIVNEQTYTFTDRGKREVTLRPEMTPTLARMIAGKHRELAFPLRWYSVPNVFRYERPQRGRLREHWQLNADIFGVSSSEAEVEIIALAYAIMRKFGAGVDDFQIRINSRKLLQEYLQGRLINKDLYEDAIRLIDRKDKIPAKEFETSWKKLSNESFALNLSADEMVADIIAKLNAQGIHNVVFWPTLTRGFDYYTGVVFEVFDTNAENGRSLFGGGRYDDLLELFGEKPIPAVGFGMGDVTLRDFLELHALLPAYRPTTDAYLIPVSPVDQSAALSVADVLRKLGLNIAVDLSDKKVGDRVKLADRNAIPFVIFVGEAEVSSGLYKCKNLKTREERTGSTEEIARIIKDSRA